VSKFTYLIFFIFILTHCSIDNKSGIWKDKKNPNNKIELLTIDFDKELTYEEFRKNVVLFGKKSKYPNLMEK
jgi:hypothetical protein